MGCGASKGTAKEQAPSDITFKPTGVDSMDNFFTKAKDILDTLTGITGPLYEERDKFFEVNGFYEVPGASKY
jgi:hypothetical protein